MVSPLVRPSLPSGTGAARLARFATALLLITAARGAAAQSVGTVSGRVTDALTGEGIQGASIAVAGTGHGAITRSDGSYRISLPPGSYELRARFVGYALERDSVQLTAGAQLTRDFRIEKSVAALSEVVVTGTRRADRTVVDAPVPIDVLTAEEITQSGRTETNQIIQMLVPSFNFPRASVADGTDHVRPSTLRGLSPDQVLVLVNGRRRHNSALVNVNGTIGRGSTGVDLNAIPAAAIDRIEVLRDGAAAQYGSDAIAGVINIILKSNAPSELSTTFGQTKEGDGDVRYADLNYSVPGMGTGYLNFTGQFRDRKNTNRSLPDTRQQYFTGDPRNTDPAFTNLINHRQGDSDARDIGGFLNAGTALARGIELYAFSGLNFRRGEAAGFFRRAMDDRTVRAIYPNGFLPLINTHVWDGSVAAGARGKIGGWNWDLSNVFGLNTFHFMVRQSANVSLGADSPTSFDAGRLRFDQYTANLDFVRPVDIGWSSPLSVAVGAEFRRDHYQIEQGEPDSYRDGGVKILDGPNAGAQPQVGAQVFPGFKPSDEQDASRNDVAAYVDIEANLTEKFLVGIAGRTEHYSDFGGTTNGKVAMRFEPVRGFALRGAASTGYRAPSLGQSYFSSTATNFIVVNGVNTPFDIRTFPVGSPEAEILGASALKPEKSVNLSGGISLQPFRALSLTADYYHIDIKDRIVFSGNFIGDDIQALLESRGYFGVRGGRFFTNAIDTRTDGMDVVLQTAIDLGRLGTSRFTGSYNHGKTKLVHIDNTPPQLGNRQEVLFDRVERARITEGQPRDNLHLLLDQSLGSFDLNVGVSRYGKVTTRGLAVDGSADQTFGAKWITDVALSYDVLRRLRATLGADNIFDVYPDENIPVNSNAGIFPYSGISPFGFNGAYYYVRLAQRF